MGGESSVVENNYPEIFDALASEYGWTFDQIGKLSFREVDFALKEIGKRRDFEARKQHSFKQLLVKLLTGKDLPALPTAEELKPVEFSEDEKTLMDQELAERLKEKQEAFRKRQEATSGRRPD